MDTTAVCHPDDISYHHMSSGWLSWSWYFIQMSYDNAIMSSEWHTLPFLCHSVEIVNFDFLQHADDISYHHMSSGWLNWCWYLIQMSYDNAIMSSGWYTLPFLCHSDEIVNFDFYNMRWPFGDPVLLLIASIAWSVCIIFAIRSEYGIYKVSRCDDAFARQWKDRHWLRQLR